MSIEAMKLALEALELWLNHKLDEDTAWEAHTALRQAIVEAEKQEQGEPVAMRYDFDGYGYKYIDSGSGSDWQTRIKDAEPLYTTPQQRTWVGLTGEEFEQLLVDAKFTRSDLLMIGACVEDICNMVEAKLKDKNL